MTLVYFQHFRNHPLYHSSATSQPGCPLTPVFAQSPSVCHAYRPISPAPSWALFSGAFWDIYIHSVR